jgi:hypothetical protein
LSFGAAQAEVPQGILRETLARNANDTAGFGMARLTGMLGCRQGNKWLAGYR